MSRKHNEPKTLRDCIKTVDRLRRVMNYEIYRMIRSTLVKAHFESTPAMWIVETYDVAVKGKPSTRKRYVCPNCCNKSAVAYDCCPHCGRHLTYNPPPKK